MYLSPFDKLPPQGREGRAPQVWTAAMTCMAKACQQLSNCKIIGGTGDIACRIVEQATPENIMVYHTQHWLPAHAGSMIADGELVAAPGSPAQNFTWLVSLSCLDALVVGTPLVRPATPCAVCRSETC